VPSARPPRAATVTLRVDKVVAGGDGLARPDDGRVVFVPGALPGELVRATVAGAGRDFARAELVEVLEPHAARREPPCPYVAAGCGGCSWQHVDPAAQLDLKVGIVREALARTGRLPAAEVDPGRVLASEGFRTTLRLAVAPDGRVGFRARGSHDVVPVERCLVAHPLLNEVLPGLRVTGPTGADAATGAPDPDPRPSGRAPRGARGGPDASPVEVVLRVGVATGEVAAALVDAPDGAVLHAPAPVVVDAAAVVHEEVAGVRFRISMPSFFQTRADGAAALVAEVRAALGDVPPTLVDAYGGVGLFAATVGAHSEVVLLEGSASSCADARHNLAGRGVVVRTPVERWVPHGTAAVVADPARAGLGKVAASVLAATHAPVLVLVSCDPVSGARDAALLAGHGYRHAGTVVVDLFPHTPHVETVTRFERVGDVTTA
jgi:23S rRNA (uracil1939-C5)-methyltransferase